MGTNALLVSYVYEQVLGTCKSISKYSKHSAALPVTLMGRVPVRCLLLRYR